jgi:hypothetical protein
MPVVKDVPDAPKTRGTPEEQLSTRGAQDLTAEELAQAREAQEARNKYLKGAREPVPAGLSPDTERLLTRSDNAIRDHMTPDDIAATLKEGRGVQITGPGGRVYDHITEVAQARTNVITTIEEIKARLQELNIAGGPQVEIDLLESKLSELSDFLDSLP